MDGFISISCILFNSRYLKNIMYCLVFIFVPVHNSQKLSASFTEFVDSTPSRCDVDEYLQLVDVYTTKYAFDADCVLNHVSVAMFRTI